ncbi:DUF350 domain-containing protein [Marinicellulosiphila megalodicopiae]|uniref:DUF350 domain-containing protein n=1 Tax=Marinicellulosiphila megalodicopiae TaxID=2724896 RepID=UPI003BAFB946
MDINNLINFAIYFFSALAFLIIFKYVYAFITPHDEWKLIKEEKNIAAAIGFGGAILGFALAVSGTISNSVSFTDYLIWTGVALIAQTAAFYIVRLVFMPKIVTRIENNEIGAGVMLAAVNVAVGLLNAACMSY